MRANGKSFYIVLPPNTNFETLTIAVLARDLNNNWAHHAKTATLGNFLPANHLATISYDLSHNDDNFLADWTLRYTATAQVTFRMMIREDAFGGNVVTHDFANNVGFIVFDDLVTCIARDAFNGSLTLTSLTAPEATTTVESSSLDHCLALTSVSIPNATTIGSHAFAFNSYLTTVNIPKATSVGYEAFAECESLTRIDMPKLESIEIEAFRYCTSLEVVIMPVIQSINSRAFYDCTSLAHVYSKTECPVIGDDVWTNVPETAILHRPGTMGGSLIPWTDWPGRTVLDYND